MAGPRPSFTKRQKERARQEKQQEKQQRRAQAKLEKEAAPAAQRSGPITIEYDEFGQPKPLDFNDF